MRRRSVSRIRLAQRMLWLAVLLLVLLSSLGYRLYGIQVANGPKYARIAVGQRTLDLPVTSRRGAILDRNGLPLTDAQSRWGVALFPPLVADRAKTAARLQPLLSAAAMQAFRQGVTGGDAVWIAQELTEAEADQVAALRLPGIHVAPTGSRYGPESLARHLVGYANDQGGQLGLEAVYDRELRGEAVPHLAVIVDGRGDALMGGPHLVKPRSGKEPYNLHTTIDLRVQQAVEEVLDTTQQPGGGPLRGAVVVLEPKSGEVLAMASRPDYRQDRNPATQPNHELSLLVNRAVVAYEPGSIFKAMVAAEALEQGVVSLDEVFDCPGTYTLNGHVIGDTAKGQMSFREAMGRSCNVAFIKVGYERLGEERLLAAARRFGFGEATGLRGLWGEADPPLPKLEFGGDVAAFAFGQGGLLVTPLQMARAYAAIANGGTLPPLQLVKAVRGQDGRVMARVPAVGEARRIISRKTAAELQQALLAVTDPKGSGTGTKAWVEGVGSAGKTGSAEGMLNGRPITHAWFVGYFPLNRPRYVISVFIEGGELGGEYAAPLFRRIAEAIGEAATAAN